MHFDPRQLNTLAAILHHGSFESAARVLGLTQSAVSQRLKALEEQTGSILVLRETPCRGTRAGRRLAAHAENVRLLEQQVQADLGGDPGGDAGFARLRIAVNADSLDSWFLPALAQIEGVVFELVVDDQDHSVGWLRRGEVVAAVTSHAAPVQGCDSLALGALSYEATASPDFIARWFATGVTVDTIARAPMLRFDAKDTLQASWMRAHLGRAVDAPSHQLPSTRGFVTAAQLGLGWGMNPAPLVAGDIEAGRLVPLLPDSTYHTPLFWQSSRMLAQALRPITRALRREARRALTQL
ncbi:MAG: ArgP/LysG family DNA-binding transcriptional regulator [Rhodobacterales bacterium]|nr:MAG: ArgP/LysG family DNA-binding transcriptional regulator [Rhodobacterales bacterium]